jgi:hypothetical protein
MVHLGGLDIGGYAPKAPAGAIGVDYGDFFPRDGEEDVGFVRIRYFGQFSPIYFPIPILFLLLQLFIGITVVREGEGRNGWSELLLQRGC